MMTIKAVLLAAIILLSDLPTLFAQESINRQQEILRFNSLFDAAKSPDEFRESAKILEALVEEGVHNGAIFYNLGNAYYRAGDFGKAILNYRKAKPFRPRDTLLEANLRQALLVAPGKLPEAAQPWWSLMLFWTEIIAYPTRVLIALGLLSLSPMLGLLAVLCRHRGLGVLAGSIAIAGLLFTTDAALNSPDSTRVRRAVITGETTARKGIGKDYEAAFDSPLKDGAEFEVIQETSGWTFGHFDGIGDGWVRNEFVAK